MQIPILIEKLPGGRFRARAGEPFALAAEGESSAVAAQELERLVAARLAQGAQLGALNLPNGKSFVSPPLPADDRYQTDPSFSELQEAIAEFRRAEDHEEQQQAPPSA